jgi:hypothetical protein
MPRIPSHQRQPHLYCCIPHHQASLRRRALAAFPAVCASPSSGAAMPACPVSRAPAVRPHGTAALVDRCTEERRYTADVSVRLTCGSTAQSCAVRAVIACRACARRWWVPRLGSVRSSSHRSCATVPLASVSVHHRVEGATQLLRNIRVLQHEAAPSLTGWSGWPLSSATAER